MSRPSDRAIAEAFAELLRAYEADPPNPGTVDYGGVFALNAIRNRAAELDASGDAEPAGVVNWTGEGGTSVTAALYRPLPHGTKLYTRPPVESAPDIDTLREDFKALAGFVDFILDDGEQGCVEPEDVDSAAVRAGLYVQQQRMVPCSDSCACVEYVDEGEVSTCNTHTDRYRRVVLAAAPAAGGGEKGNG